jgi:hypothetical protein
MTVDFAYQLMQFIVNKNQNGYLSPDNFNLVINQAQYSFMDYLLGEFQNYQAGRPVAKVQYGNNEEVRQRLTPLIQEPYPLTIDATGHSSYPPNYQQTDAMYDIYMNRIRYVQQHKLFSYLNSKIDPISTNPIFLIQNIYYQFYPNVAYNNVPFSNAYVSYVQTPPTITWAYTTDIHGLPVYNPAGSVDPIWYDMDMLEIITRALAMVGVNLQSQEVAGYSNQIKIGGQ